jgi:hypothetical protein
MGKGGRVDDDRINLRRWIGKQSVVLDIVHELAFVVGLDAYQFNAMLGGTSDQTFFNLCQCGMPIYFRLAFA